MRRRGNEGNEGGEKERRGQGFLDSCGDLVPLVFFDGFPSKVSAFFNLPSLLNISIVSQHPIAALINEVSSWFP